MIAANQPENMTQLVLWAAVLLAAFGGMAIVIYVLRRRVRGDRPEEGSLWNLHDLSAMRDRGELTENEYRALKTRVIESFTAQSNGGPATDTPRTDAAKG